MMLSPRVTKVTMFQQQLCIIIILGVCKWQSREGASDPKTQTFQFHSQKVKNFHNIIKNCLCANRSFKLLMNSKTLPLIQTCTIILSQVLKLCKQTLRKSEFQDVLLISSLSDSNTAIITYIHNVYMSSVFLGIS